MDKQRLARQIGQELRDRGWTFATAESCTGGLVSHIITNIPGSSDYFAGSIIAYAYQAKVDLLNVSWETLKAHGAVSEPTVLEMARGARRAFGADVALSITGIAGPGGATPEKPVGTVYFGLCSRLGEDTLPYHSHGSRLENKHDFALQALQYVWEHLTQDG